MIFVPKQKLTTQFIIFSQETIFSMRNYNIFGEPEQIFQYNV